MESKRVFVLGMARSGYEAAKLLVAKGYTVLVNDGGENHNPEHIDELKSLGIELVLGSHPDDLFDDSFSMVVKNPGISNEHKFVKKAVSLGIPIINEMELAYRYFPEGVRIIGITGTNGKTTTTTITYEIFKEAMDRVFLAGNIGFPVCSIVPDLQPNDIVIMEVSDHQLSNVLEFRTDIAILTNLFEAHIDFHGSYEKYIAMKKRIFNYHTGDNTAILNLDNNDVIALTKDIGSMKKYFSSKSVTDCCIYKGAIWYDGEKVISLDDIKIKGTHNYENTMASIMVAKEFGIDNKTIARVMREFNGVEHRLEYVRTVKGVDYYNDSKATNIKSTQIALSSFTKPTTLLLGGMDRGHSFEELKEYLGWVNLIISYGETKNRIDEFAEECDIECIVVDTLDQAVMAAYETAKRNSVVLLSPACASWDQFADFEARGNMFKACVNNL